MRWFHTLCLLLASLRVTFAQFRRGSVLYDEAIANSEAALEETIQQHEDVKLEFFHNSQFIYADNYTFEFPIPEDYRLNIIVDPCRGNPFNCCINVFGTPEYPMLISNTLEAERQIKIPVIAEEGEVAVNYNLIYDDWSSVPERDTRTPDDYAYLETECLSRKNPSDFCMGKNFGYKVSELQPACIDHNSSIDAQASCYDIHGDLHPYCVAIAYTQSAFIPQCHEEFTIRGDDSHCGTYIEIHQIHGTPYSLERDIIGSVKIDTRNVSGYYTTTIPTTWMGDMRKVLCAYLEAFFRVGSVVFITDEAPVCCCMSNYNPLTRLGSFMCPRSAQGNGPFAAQYTQLSDVITRDSLILQYPYCHSDLDEGDRMMCSTYDPYNRAFYTRDCLPVTQTTVYDSITNTSIPIPGVFTSPELLGPEYSGICPYFPNCALTLDDGKCRLEDFPFSFIGLVGVVTAIDVNHPIPIVSVTFNNGRTSYDFLQTHLKLEPYKSMYELWWVLRTPSQFIVQKRKGFAVTNPSCTFDNANNRYFPYAILNEDGTPRA